MDPLWNHVVVGGLKGGKPFLGTVDYIGTQYEGDYIATGFGLHLAMPLLRDNWVEDMSEDDARALLEKVYMVSFVGPLYDIRTLTSCDNLWNV